MEGNFISTCLWVHWNCYSRISLRRGSWKIGTQFSSGCESRSATKTLYRPFEESLQGRESLFSRKTIGKPQRIAFESNVVMAHEYGCEKCSQPAAAQSDYHLRSFLVLSSHLILRSNTKATFKEIVNKGKSSASHRTTRKTAPVYVFFVFRAAFSSLKTSWEVLDK